MNFGAMTSVQSVLTCFIVVALLISTCNAVVIENPPLPEFEPQAQNEPMRNSVFRPTEAKEISDTLLSLYKSRSIRATSTVNMCGTAKKTAKIIREHLRKSLELHNLPLRNHAHITVVKKGPCQFLVIFPLRKRFLIEAMSSA